MISVIKTGEIYSYTNIVEAVDFTRKMFNGQGKFITSEKEIHIPTKRG